MKKERLKRTARRITAFAAAAAMAATFTFPAEVGEGFFDGFGNAIVASAEIILGFCGDNLTCKLDDNGTLTISGTGEMYNYSNPSEVPWYDFIDSIKSVVIENGVTSIGDHAFENCSSLTSITIPDGVASIGECAFYDCLSLTSITIPDSVNSIGNYAFEGCSSLTGITIPDGVTSIGGSAFYDCTNLKSITIPDSVTSIEYGAFSGCSSLTSITIPDGVTSIGNYAFENCSGLTGITIPDGVTYIGEGTFSLCKSLTSITIPGNVTSIGTSAFRYCTSLTSITIPSSVTSIGYRAFSICNNLTSITIPESVTSIGTDAIPASATQIKYTVSGNEVTITEITLGTGQTSVAIPETIGGKSVASIADNALAGCSNLESIIIPKDLDISNAGIPSSASQIRYTVDNENVTITAVTLVGDASGFVLPNKIGGKAVTNIADGALASCPKVSHEHREKTAATCIAKAFCAICETGYGEIGAHSLNKHDAVPASCTTDGNTEHYKCDVCGKLFTDESGTTETTVDAVTISAIGHSMSHIYANVPTCTEDGNTEHYKCDVCGKLFTDKSGTTETTPEAVTIPAAGHSFGIACDSNAGGHYYVCAVCGEKSDIEEHIKDNGTVTKEATLTESGTITYKCTVCGAKMGEETITAEITSIEVTESNVVVHYTVTGSTEVMTQKYSFDEVTEEMVELMKSKDIKLVIDFVNYSTAGSDTIILTAAQMKAIEYVLAHDFGIAA